MLGISTWKNRRAMKNDATQLDKYMPSRDQILGALAYEEKYAPNVPHPSNDDLRDIIMNNLDGLTEKAKERILKKMPK